MATIAPDRLHYTDSDEANELLARDPLALLIGFALDQQVPVQTAFTGPLKIKQLALGSVLAKRFGVEAAQGLVPGHPTLGDVDSRQALERYQDAKRAHKARMRAGNS